MVAGKQLSNTSAAAGDQFTDKIARNWTRLTLNTKIEKRYKMLPKLLFDVTIWTPEETGKMLEDKTDKMLEDMKPAFQ